MSVIHNPYPYTGAGATINIASGAGTNGTVLTSSSKWQDTDSTVQINGTLKILGTDADIDINGIKLTALLSDIAARLAILQPDPVMLKKHEALRQAYEHYKTLEALLYDNPSPK